MDPGCCGHVGEFSIAFIPVKAVAGIGIEGGQFALAGTEGSILMDGMVEQVHVQVAVSVHIDEGDAPEASRATADAQSRADEVLLIGSNEASRQSPRPEP